MKYSVTVKPNAKTTSISQNTDGNFHINVKAPAKDGKANKEVVRLIAKFLKVPQSHIVIKHGTSGREKLIEII